MLLTEMFGSGRSIALRQVQFSPASSVMIGANCVMELQGRLRSSQAGRGLLTMITVSAHS